MIAERDEPDYINVSAGWVSWERCRHTRRRRGSAPAHDRGGPGGKRSVRPCDSVLVDAARRAKGTAGLGCDPILGLRKDSQ
jgi:hypothetical protein